jgi:hypothetical protein
VPNLDPTYRVRSGGGVGLSRTPNTGDINHTVPYGTDLFSNISQALNCQATVIQTLWVGLASEAAVQRVPTLI